MSSKDLLARVEKLGKDHIRDFLLIVIKDVEEKLRQDQTLGQKEYNSLELFMYKLTESSSDYETAGKIKKFIKLEVKTADEFLKALNIILSTQLNPAERTAALARTKDENKNFLPLFTALLSNELSPADLVALRNFTVESSDPAQAFYELSSRKNPIYEILANFLEEIKKKDAKKTAGKSTPNIDKSGNIPPTDLVKHMSLQIKNLIKTQYIDEDEAIVELQEAEAIMELQEQEAQAIKKLQLVMRQFFEFLSHLATFHRENLELKSRDPKSFDNLTSPKDLPFNTKGGRKTSQINLDALPADVQAILKGEWTDNNNHI